MNKMLNLLFLTATKCVITRLDPDVHIFLFCAGDQSISTV
jgi:hypothetical protein